MGTNYYLVTRNKELAEKYFPFEYEITDRPFFCYCVHLNKCSLGWRTLFQAHDKAYKSVRELRKFLNDHVDECEIYDEYDEKYSVQEYDDAVLKRDESLLMEKEPYCWKDDELFGGKSLLPCEEGDTPVIYSPFDHQEYERAEAEFFRRAPFLSGGYFTDEEGYNFSLREFS